MPSPDECTPAFVYRALHPLCFSQSIALLAAPPARSILVSYTALDYL
ncbi:hypothetical protein PAMC26510_30635 [Caballeronia sordidicola]|uniref:Uncharacterized protein n=1 Tax=Caballeronia sordidicola TaxID=196367 RepID=A0A242M8H5_CABSO|nr:hypothetical protein PAMC26510_30635 [Caballeronia sordidicola]